MKNVLTIFGMTLLLAACSSSPMQVGKTVTIDMVADGFTPDPITAQKGQQVCWINKDTHGRWPASNIHPTHEIYSAFDPKKPVVVGETWCFVFDRAGIWRYHDHLLPEFVGMVNVE